MGVTVLTEQQLAEHEVLIRAGLERLPDALAALAAIGESHRALTENFARDVEIAALAWGERALAAEARVAELSEALSELTDATTAAKRLDFDGGVRGKASARFGEAVLRARRVLAGNAPEEVNEPEVSHKGDASSISRPPASGSLTSLGGTVPVPAVEGDAA